MPDHRAQEHPLRDRLLSEYAAAPRSPSDLARRLGRPLNLVSYHTGVLRERGFLELVRTERRRGGTAHVYRAVTAPVIDDDAWIVLPAQVRRMLVRRLIASIAEATRVAALDGGFDPAHAHVSRWPVELDEPARQAVARVLRRLLDDLGTLQAAADRRACAEQRSVEVVLMGFRR